MPLQSNGQIVWHAAATVCASGDACDVEGPFVVDGNDILDVRTGPHRFDWRRVGTLESPRAVYVYAFAPNGRRLCASSVGSTELVLAATDGHLLDRVALGGTDAQPQLPGRTELTIGELRFAREGDRIAASLVGDVP